MRTADQQPDEHVPTYSHRNATCRVCGGTIAAYEEAYGRKGGNGTQYRHRECRIDVADPSDEGSQRDGNRLVFGMVRNRARVGRTSLGRVVSESIINKQQ
jgi:hypothetical protein